MLGAVAGPLLAVVFVASGASFGTIILASVAPSMISVLAIVLLTRDRGEKSDSAGTPRAPLPKRFWLLLAGVLVFGLGDFSRSFLVLLAARASGGQPEKGAAHGVSVAVLLYVFHNAVSALVAYPVGRLGDRKPKLVVLAVGYAAGALVNGMLAWQRDSIAWLAVVVTLSGAYIAVEETIEKAACAELLPREQRSLGLGIFACANAVGDMVSSIVVGLLLSSGQGRLAFGLAGACSLAGACWILLLARTRRE
jgi:MFS family permease